MEQSRARRVGAAAVVCAMVTRFFTLGLPGKLAARLVQPDAAAFLIYLETGHHVRFSPYSGDFSPEFEESPGPAADIPAVAAFSEAVRVYNTSGLEPPLEELMAEPLSWDLHGEQPRVLILHTHATESYTRQGEEYRESSEWRTLDGDYNMLSIGARVAEILEGQGIPTVQDRTLHDYPSYNGSYVHARNSLRQLLETYPEVQLVLDLHRDASEGPGGQMRTKAMVGDRDSAQLMLVMGCKHENFSENLSLALKLHSQLEHQAPGITRPLQLRPSRFNQDLSPGALLVEVGAAGNTHAEALTAAEQLAWAIVALAKGTE